MRKYGGITALNDALSDALHRHGIDMKLKEAELTQRWKEIVGQAIGDCATPTRFKDGTLWIKVTSAPWRQELVLLRSELRAKLNDALGVELVKEIVIK